MHAFSYSPREGTPAAKLPQLDEKIKSARLHKLLSEAEEARKKYTAARIGREYDFLAEAYGGGFTTGYTANYIKIYLPAEVKSGEFYKIKIKDLYGDGAIADLAE